MRAVIATRRCSKFYATFIIWLLLCALYLLNSYLRPVSGHVDPYYGKLSQVGPSSNFAIATFLSTDCKEDDDFYYVAARVLTYQLFHDPQTRCNRSIPFLILVTSEVPQDKRDRLTADGATVVPVEGFKLPSWVHTGVTRWKDQFTKLRIFEMIEYDRVLFIDADTLLMRPIDGIFDERISRTPATTLSHRTEQIKADEAPLPANYLFAARSDNALNGERDHPFPPPPTTVFSAGFWLAAPSVEMSHYLLSILKHRRRFNPFTMEQSMLNYAFRREGAMPWFELDFKWSATWPSMNDVNGDVATLHEKFEWTGPAELKELWLDTKRKMEKFWS